MEWTALSLHPLSESLPLPPLPYNMKSGIKLPEN